MPDTGAADAFMEIFGFTRAKNKEDSDMKRYAMDYYIEHLCGGPACNVAMMETADGEWVRYDDAARLQAENERLSTAHELFEAACEDIALLQAENERMRALLLRADDELHEMTQMDCPSSVERDEDLLCDIRAALSHNT